MIIVYITFVNWFRSVYLYYSTVNKAKKQFSNGAPFSCMTLAYSCKIAGCKTCWFHDDCKQWWCWVDIIKNVAINYAQFCFISAKYRNHAGILTWKTNHLSKMHKHINSRTYCSLTSNYFLWNILNVFQIIYYCWLNTFIVDFEHILHIDFHAYFTNSSFHCFEQVKTMCKRYIEGFQKSNYQ